MCENNTNNFVTLDSVTALQIMIDNLPFNAWLKDNRGVYLAVNKSFTVYVGLAKEEILGKKDFDIFPVSEATIHVTNDNAVMSGEKEGYFENLIDGKWKEEYKQAVRDHEGKIIGTTGFARDITERKRIEEELKESERSKAVLLSNLPGVAFRSVRDKEYTMTFLSDGCFELTGYYPEELLNNKSISYNELISPEFREILYEKWSIGWSKNLRCSDEYTIVTKEGKVKWVWEQSIGVADKNGEITESEGFILDITDIKNAVEALNESEDRFRTIFETAPLGIGIFNTNTGIVSQLNPRFGEILGRPVQELLTMDWISYSHPEEVQENQEKLNLLKENKINSFKMHKRYYKPDGSVVWVNMMIVPFKVKTMQHMHVCMIEDITENKKKEENIIYLSYHDTLTGLHNRTFFEEEKKRLDSSRQLPISVIMGDVNGLKMINDSFGHNVGDKLLKEAAFVLKNVCRDEDIVARIGGDEFVILLPQTDRNGAFKLCKRIEKACSDYVKKQDQQNFHLSISLGYATKTQKDQTIDELLIEAEKMLYENKNVTRK
jgi:diguanylate cyclase (GGDEF)-like protein/PAS domain S-box-containing protein